MPLRKHQYQFEMVKARVLAGQSRAREIVIKAVPGAGKSTIPVQACELIKKGLAKRLLWVVPRLSLAYQAESNFVDPFFREMFRHRFNIRAATNDLDPCRGTFGFVTTYQAIGMDSNLTVLREVSSKEYIVVLDEFHHLEVDGVWHNALKPITDRAQILILMTGTMARGDKKRIAYLPYGLGGGSSILDDISRPSGAEYIEYSRSDALQEKSILPTKFFLFDGWVEYEKKLTGSRQKGQLSEFRQDANAAICTALNTKFAENLLDEGLRHWVEYKKNHPRSKLMVVCTDIEHAKYINDLIKLRRFRSKVAASDDPRAVMVLKEFKHTDLDILTSIAMAYEGFDCKPLTHVIFLTRIRSVPWIEQVIARPVRIDPEAGPYESQCSFVFAPDDTLFREVVEVIESEQVQAARTPQGLGQLKLFKEEGDGGYDNGIDYIDGGIQGKREMTFGNMPTGEIVELTMSEREKHIRKQIDEYVKHYCQNFNKEYRTMNKEIKTAFNKGRDKMSLSELKQCYEYVKVYYPISGLTKSGRRRSRRRVPNRAVPWSG